MLTFICTDSHKNITKEKSKNEKTKEKICTPCHCIDPCNLLFYPRIFRSYRSIGRQNLSTLMMA